MAALVIPASLPLPGDGGFMPNDLRALVSEGPFSARLCSSDETAQQTVSWVLSDAKAAVFWDWWRVDLQQGGNWWASSHSHPDGYTAHVYRFESEPDTTYLPGGARRVTATLQVRGASLLPATGVPSFVVGSAAVSESAGSAQWAVSIQPATIDAVGLSFAITGTATAGSDYTATIETSIDNGGTWQAGATRTLASGTGQLRVRVALTDDSTAEGDETLILTVTRTSGTTSNASAAGTVTVRDNDQPALSVNDISVAEAAGFAVFTVTLSAASAAVVSVSYATASGTATAGVDFLAASGALVFAAGETSQTVSVPVLSDGIAEGTETFTLGLSDAVGATLADATGVCTIQTSSAGGALPSVSVGDVTVAESAGNAVFTITLSGTSAVDVTVGYATEDVTAVAGQDYTARSGAAVIAAGATTATVSVPILVDTLSEGAETFKLVLSGVLQCTIADDTGVCTISSNIAVPVASVNSISVAESAGAAVFTVTLSGIYPADVSFAYATANGSATAGADYTAASGTLLIPAGATSGTVSVTILGDTTGEGNETFTLTLSSPINATLGLAVGTCTILANAGLPVLSIADVTVSEAAGPAVFTVTLSAVSASTVTVAYATADGTATAGSDYTAASGTLTFTPGQTSKTISVTLANDTAVESNETFTVTLSSPTNATLGTSVATGTITSDDIASGHRYWRLNVTALAAGAEGSFFAMNEIQLLVGSTDATTGRGAYASQTGNGNAGTADSAVDNDTGTQFGSSWTGSYIWTIDLGSAQAPTSMTLRCDGNANKYAAGAFTLQYSDDGSTGWTTAITQTGLTWATTETKTFTL